VQAYAKIVLLEPIQFLPNPFSAWSAQEGHFSRRWGKPNATVVIKDFFNRTVLQFCVSLVLLGSMLQKKSWSSALTARLVELKLKSARVTVKTVWLASSRWHLFHCVNRVPSESFLP